MTAVLKVKDGGSWRTVVEPYVNVDGTWKTVHNIWIKHGDTWRLSHKTAFSRYIESYDSGFILNSGTITIDTSVRYIKVQLSGSGGGGGGGIKTTGSWGDSHATCPFTGYSFSAETARGGYGGQGGYLDVVLEVTPGETYTYTYAGAGLGGTVGTPFHLSTFTAYSAGHSGSGNDNASQGGASEFRGPNGTELIAFGGSPGPPGTLTVSSACVGAGTYTQFRGQNVSVTNGADAADGSTVLTAGNLVQTNANTTGGGAAGGNGLQGDSGAYGGPGSIRIYQYKASKY